MERAAIVFHLGPLAITATVLTTWGIMLLLGFAAWLSTRRLSLDPGPLQTLLEGIVSAMDDAIRAMLPQRSQMLLPFIGTLWVYVLVANLTGLIPGLSSPTASLSVTAGLALLVSIKWGLKDDGVYCTAVMLAALCGARLLARPTVADSSGHAALRAESGSSSR